MKKTLLKFALSFIALTFASSFFAQESTQGQITISENGEKWMTLKTESGVRVSFTENFIGDNRYLHLQFTNTTSDIVKFSWTLKNKKDNILINSEPLVIAAGKTKKVFDIKKMLKSKKDQKLNVQEKIPMDSEFLININL